MKRVTATDARRHWFRLLDEVAAGEVVAIEREGRTILLQRAPTRVAREKAPDYSSLIRASRAEGADQWRWVWPGPEKALRSADASDDEGP